MQKIIVFISLFLTVLSLNTLQAQESSQVFAKEVLTFFYPDNPPTQMNANLEQMAHIMLKKAMKASRQLDKVPRPSGFKPGIGWLTKTAVQQLFHSSKSSGIYESVRVTLAASHKTAYHLAQY